MATKSTRPKRQRLTMKEAGRYSPVSLYQSDIKTVRAVARTTFDTANRRISRLKKEPHLYVSSPAIFDLGEHAKFSSKYLSKDELITEIERARFFLEDYTSTVSGAEENYLELVSGLTELNAVELTQELTTEEWKMLHQSVLEIQLADREATIPASDLIRLSAAIITNENESLNVKLLTQKMKKFIKYKERIGDPYEKVKPLLTKRPKL